MRPTTKALRRIAISAITPGLMLLLGLSLIGADTPIITAAPYKPIIYQLFVRVFTSRGTSATDIGTFNAITDQALTELRRLGTDIVWLTGVMEHASTLTDDPDVVKGTAGSPYAIRDYYDVHSELGTREDFKRLVDRIHAHGMKTVIDLVANHTARVNIVDVPGKETMAFGIADDPSRFFDLNNNYYYIKPDAIFAPPPRFGIRNSRSYDGTFDRDIHMPGIQYEYPAKVSGNDVVVPNPDFNSWFETVKLNYGYDFRPGGGHYYSRDPLNVPFSALPSTWQKMIDVIIYWLDLGVDGFRCDIANMVPIGFWKTAIYYARQSHPNAYFMMEAYESSGADPIEYSHAKMFAAGADAIYAQPIYEAAKAVFQSGGSASNIGSETDRILAKAADGGTFVTYIENHDQIRAASRFFKQQNPGPEYGFALSKFLFGLPGPFMIYNGQEVGETGDSADGHTSIFDYTKMPTFAGWINGGRFDGKGLGPETQDLRARYAQTFAARYFPAIAAGHSAAYKSYANLSSINRYDYRLEKFVAAYARFYGEDRYLIVANFSPDAPTETTLHFTVDGQDVTGVLHAWGVSNSPTECWRFTDAFTGWVPVDTNATVPGTLRGSELWKPYGIPSGLYLGKIPPLTVYYLKLDRC